MLPCESAEYKKSITELLNIIRDASAAYKALIGETSSERKDALMKVGSTLPVAATDMALA